MRIGMVIKIPDNNGFEHDLDLPPSWPDSALDEHMKIYPLNGKVLFQHPDYQTYVYCFTEQKYRPAEVRQIDCLTIHYLDSKEQTP